MSLQNGAKPIEVYLHASTPAVVDGIRHKNHPDISNVLEAQLNKTFSHFLLNNTQ
jgi:hypothetical protein